VVTGYRLEVPARLSGPELAEVGALLDRAAAATGHAPLDEQHRVDLAAGRHHGLVPVVARRDPSGALAGYAHLLRVRDGWSVEVVTVPAPPDAAGDGDGDQGDRDGSPARALLEAAVAEVRRRGGGHLRSWAPMATGRQDADAAALGLVPERDLLQLRVALPLPSAVRGAPFPPGVVLRAFRPGRDEAAWLDVNNRAFAGHPEQGGWDLATLTDRERQPWFDPAAFVVAEEGGRLVGSCWMKVHRDTDPVLGEIYVIAVDPDRHQRGLGRALAVAGLGHVAAAGVAVGMLYVDGDNEPALALYRSLGFTRHHVDRSYVGEIAGDAPPAGGRAQAPETPTSRPIP
jgi:mycothiol synthase